MKKYKSIVVDDDPISQKIVSKCIQRSGIFEEPILLNDALGLKEILLKEKVDVIFLDIELPELSGLDFIKAFEDLPTIVLMSNMKKYAVDAFEFEVLDFLPKPIEYGRFLKTVNKLEKVFTPNNNAESDSIFFKVNGKLQKIKLSHILFLNPCPIMLKSLLKKKHMLFYKR